MNTVPTTPHPGESHPHYKMIIGLVELAGFLTDHPQLQVNSSLIRFFPDRGEDSENIALVRQMASILNVDATWNHDETHFEATRSFGAITYEAIAIRRECMRDFEREGELGKQALAAEKAAAAAPTVEMVFAIDDQAPVVEQLPATAAPVDEGHAAGDAGEPPVCATCGGHGHGFNE